MVFRLACVALLVSSAGCSGGASAPIPAPCDAGCADDVALLALRDAVKLVYNVALQGRDAGLEAATTPCPLGGMATVSGSAYSDADLGTTTVHLTYAFDACGYAEQGDDSPHTFSMTLTGQVTEDGTLAEPPSTTGLEFNSASMTFAGTVYDPPIDYQQDCALALSQSGDDIAGTICTRSARSSL